MAKAAPVAPVNIEAAVAILGRIAFSGGAESDPHAQLLLWRSSEGIEEGALEAAAHASALETMQEIEAAIEEGQEISKGQLVEYLEREYVTAFLIGWITRARAQSRQSAAEDAGKA